MNKEQFYLDQKNAIKEKYSRLRNEKKKRDECLDVLAKEYNCSKSTIEQILYNPNYRKPTNKGQPKPVPKA